MAHHFEDADIIPVSYESDYSDPDGFRNIGSRTCYLNSTLQLLRPIRTIFREEPRCSQCKSCQAFRIFRMIYFDEIDITIFVKYLDMYMDDYSLYEWHSSKEFLDKVLNLLMIHNSHLLSKFLLKVTSKDGASTTYRGIQSICRSESIPLEFDMLQINGTKFGDFPEVLIVCMNSVKPSSLPKKGVKIRNYENKRESLYRIVGCVTGSGKHAISITYRNDLKRGKPGWYFFDDDLPKKKTNYDGFVRNVCSRDTVVELFLLVRLSQEDFKKQNDERVAWFDEHVEKRKKSGRDVILRTKEQQERHEEMIEEQNHRDVFDEEEEEVNDDPIPIYDPQLVFDSSVIRLELSSHHHHHHAMQKPTRTILQVNEYRFCPYCAWVGKKSSKHQKFEVCLCCESKFCFNCLKFSRMISEKGVHDDWELCDPMSKCHAKETQLGQCEERRNMRLKFEEEAKKVNVQQLKEMRTSLRLENGSQEERQYRGIMNTTKDEEEIDIVRIEKKMEQALGRITNINHSSSSSSSQQQQMIMKIKNLESQISMFQKGEKVQKKEKKEIIKKIQKQEKTIIKKNKLIEKLEKKVSCLKKEKSEESKKLKSAQKEIKDMHKKYDSMLGGFRALRMKYDEIEPIIQQKMEKKYSKFVTDMREKHQVLTSSLRQNVMNLQHQVRSYETLYHGGGGSSSNHHGDRTDIPSNSQFRQPRNYHPRNPRQPPNQNRVRQFHQPTQQQQGEQQSGGGIVSGIGNVASSVWKNSLASNLASRVFGSSANEKIKGNGRYGV